MSGLEGDRSGRVGRALRASGLPALWAARYPALADPQVGARAGEHVSGSLGALPGTYRLAAIVGLRVAGLALRVTAAGRPGSAAGYDRLARLPFAARLLAVTDSLALYGGLDGGPDT
ncbi:hypothetical protein [Streptomyces sp. NPDC007100]|uniref:hypothetical protein n=1 Tax=Streptomyces sp. NPDC007100 TaxID=3155602 RepID=UPI00340357CD